MTDAMRLPCLEIRQGSDRRLYSFAVDGKRLASICTVSRIHRDESAAIAGYQRPEALAHVKAIKDYLETDGALMPNALVVAFDERVRFEPAISQDAGADAVFGTLVVPVCDDPEDERPGWVVDGQQRSAALRDADVARFPVPVIAFITSNLREQRAQFILVNSTKPLPKGLIHELLPATDGALPGPLRRRRFPVRLLERLNHDSESPLFRMIRTPTTVDGQIKDNSMLKMLENSLTDGALYEFYDSEAGDGDIDKMLGVLWEFWAAVSDVFPNAWDKPPRRSRLMHGVGIVSMGFVMDTITAQRGVQGLTREEYAHELRHVAPACAWTEGQWTFSPYDTRRWNGVQNTPKDIQLVTDLLLREYRKRRGPEHLNSRAA
jgi:DGQHR domain-containing protein